MMIAANQNPEQIARDKIDINLEPVGWVVQDKNKSAVEVIGGEKFSAIALDLQGAAVQTVLQRAEVLSARWAA